jgi:hypothetical protein
MSHLFKLFQALLMVRESKNDFRQCGAIDFAEGIDRLRPTPPDRVHNLEFLQHSMTDFIRIQDRRTQITKT